MGRVQQVVTSSLRVASSRTFSLFVPSFGLQITFGSRPRHRLSLTCHRLEMTRRERFARSSQERLVVTNNAFRIRRRPRK